MRWAWLATSASGRDEFDGVAGRLIRCASLGMALHSPQIVLANYGLVVWERDDGEVELAALMARTGARRNTDDRTTRRHAGGRRVREDK